MARGLAPDGRTKPGARVGWGAVAAGARALKEKAERSGASPCEFDYQVGRRGCLLLAIGPVREAQNPAASSRVLRASAVRSSTLYAIEDLRFTIYERLDWRTRPTGLRRCWLLAPPPADPSLASHMQEIPPGGVEAAPRSSARRS